MTDKEKLIYTKGKIEGYEMAMLKHPKENKGAVEVLKQWRRDLEERVRQQETKDYVKGPIASGSIEPWPLPKLKVAK